MAGTVMIDAESFSASVVRQFSLWPFGTRTLRLFILVDPSPAPAPLVRGVLRAMQQAVFRAETGSLTNAVHAAVRAAQFVLQHHNRDVLPQDHVTAGLAVAVARGDLAYVALVGDAAAFAWRRKRLTGHDARARVARPVGLEQEPRITLWRTPLARGDRLVLVSGANWPSNSADAITDAMESAPAHAIQARLTELLAGRVLVADPAAPAGQPTARRERAPRPRRGMPTAHALRRWLAPLVPLGALSIGAVSALGPTTEPQHVALAQQAETLLVEAQQARDVYRAHSLAATARDYAQRAASLAPTQHGQLLSTTALTLDEIDRVYGVQPWQSVRFGPTGTNIVDVAVGPDALYTLDVLESAVRRFDLAATDQQPTPDTLLLRQGTPIANRRFDAPVAMQYLMAGSEAGALTVVDSARSVVQLTSDGNATMRSLPSSQTWQRLGALAAGGDGGLFVLDTGAHRLLEYGGGQRLSDPPRALLDPSLAADLTLEHAAEVLVSRDVYLRMANGSVRRFDRQGRDLSFSVEPPDGRAVIASALASDRTGGLYLADPAHARIVHATADGDFLRQLRDPTLAGVRQMQASLDGRRLYALVASGVLVFELPEEILAPVPSRTTDTVEEPLTPLPK
jgi:hypothetical protein